MAKRFCYLISFLLFLNNICFAQASKKYFISTELGIGSMLIPENKTLLNDYIPNIDISIAKSMHANTDEWIRRLNVDYQMATLSYMNQSSLTGMLDTAANSFGNVYMLTYSLMIHLLGNKNTRLYFIPGWGIAYDTKTFYDNSDNIYIGSHLNYAIRFEGLLSQKINDRLNFNTGVKYMHYSNGAYVLPNRGINSVSYKIGLAYLFSR